MAWMLEPGFSEVSAVQPANSRSRADGGAFADTFLKNVYMTTNIPERTVQLSGRTDLSLSSTFSPNRW